MTQSIQSQIINITESQKKRIDSIFTAEKIIEISKGLSNEKLQEKQIKRLEQIIQKKDSIIQELRAEYVKTLKSISLQNQVVKTTTKQVDSITEKQLRKERFRWSGLHLYGGAESRQFNLNNIELNGELMYELRKVHFGVQAVFFPDELGNYKLGTGFKIRYKFF